MNAPPPSSTPEPAASSDDTPKRTPNIFGRWLRWLRWGLLGLLSLMAIAVGVAGWGLAHLGHPWVQGIAHDTVRNATGLEVRWQEGVVTTNKVTLRGLEVQSAPVDRDLAPVALRVEEIVIPVELDTLRRGIVRSEGVVVRGVKLTVLVDADGGLSVSRLVPAANPPPTKPAKSALQLLDVVPTGSQLKMNVSDVELVVLQRGRNGGEARRLTLDKIGATVALDAGKAPFTLDATVRGPGRVVASAGEAKEGPMGLPPLRHFSIPPMPDDKWQGRWDASQAAWKLDLSSQTNITLTDGQALRLVVDVGAPNGLPLPDAPTRVVQATLDVTRLKQQRLSAQLKGVHLLDGAFQLDAGAEFSDHHASAPGPLTQVHAHVSGALAPWLDWIPASVGVASARTLGGSLTLRAERVILAEALNAPWFLDARTRADSLSARGPSSDAKPTSSLGLPGFSAKVALGQAHVTGHTSAKSITLDISGSTQDVATSMAQGGARWQSAELSKTRLRATRDPSSTWGWRIDTAKTHLNLEGAVATTAEQAQQARLTGGFDLQANGTPAGLHAVLSGRLDVDAHVAAPAMGVTATQADLTMTMDVNQRKAGDATSWQLNGGKGSVSFSGLRVAQGNQRTRMAQIKTTFTTGLVALIDEVLHVQRMSVSTDIGRFAGANVQIATPLHGSLKVAKLRVPVASPTEGRGEVEVRGDAFGNSLFLGLKRPSRPLQWDATVSAPNIAQLVAAIPLPRATRRMVRWQNLQIKGSSSGQIRNPLSPFSSPMRHDSQVDITGLDLRLPSLRVHLPHTKLTAKGSATGNKLAQEFTVRMARPRIGGWRGEASLPITGTVRIDPNKPSLHVDGNLRFSGGPTWGLTLDAAHGGGEAVVSWNATSTKLKALGNAVPKELQKAACLDARRLSGSWRGTLRLPMARRHLLAPKAWQRAVLPIRHASMRVDHTLVIRGLRCRRPKLALASPEVKVVSATRLKGGKVSLDSHMLIRRLRGHVNDRRIDLHGLDQGVIVKASLPPKKAPIRLELNGLIKRFDQDLLPAWPIAQARLTGVIVAKQGNFVRLQNLTLVNPKGGTILRISGGMDAGKAPKGITKVTKDPNALQQSTNQQPSEEQRGDQQDDGTDPTGSQPLPGRRGFTFTGELVQDMSQLGAANDHVRGKGRVVVPYRIESGDLRVFRMTAKPTFEAVDITLPKWRFSVRGVSGSLPVVEVIDVRDGSVQLLGGGTHNPLARWRFQDQQPFLSGDPYLGLEEVRFDKIRFGPIAGNARLDRNVFRLDQLEARAMRGQITGQCIIDWEGRDTVVLFRGNGTGLRLPGSDKRMDLNAAVRFQAGQLALSGQAQLLRASREHLEAMLDLWDPYRADARTNKLRLLLKMGYPDRVRVVFRHGFADFLVALGGIADVFTIEEIKGIPLGPMMQRWVAPYLPKETR